MCLYGKTILTCFKSIDSVAKQIENLIKKKAKASFYSYSSAYNLSKELINLSEIRRDLLELKEITLEALSLLNNEYRNLIYFKYFKIVPNDENFEHTSRNYFRKQIKAMNKFHEKLNLLGLTEEWFFKKYLKISFINGVYQKTLNEEGKKHVI